MDLATAMVIFLGILCSCLLAIVVGMSYRLHKLEHLYSKMQRDLEHQINPFPLPPDQVIRWGDGSEDAFEEVARVNKAVGGAASLKRQAD